MMTVIDHKKSMWELRREEHDRQMRIVWRNAAGAIVIVIAVLVWL